MIIPDINLLLYAHDKNYPQHERAAAWWEEVAQGPNPVGMPWVILSGFLRLSTTLRVQRRPLSVEEAIEITDGWQDIRNIQIIEPGPRHYKIFRELILQTVGGNLVTDAHLAAIDIEYNAELHSNDNDFARFNGLKWHNPLKEHNSGTHRR